MSIFSDFLGKEYKRINILKGKHIKRFRTMITSFQEKVYFLCKRIPKGRVCSYGGVAKALGKKCSRAVGNALNKNPYGAKGLSLCRQQVVPCHRIVRSDGSIGGFASGVKKKIVLLRKEGVRVSKNKIVDFEKRFFRL